MTELEEEVARGKRLYALLEKGWITREEAFSLLLSSDEVIDDALDKVEEEHGKA